MKQSFIITCLSRADLVETGFTESEIKAIPDWKMERLARKMGEAYVENGYWIDLESLARDILINE